MFFLRYAGRRKQEELSGDPVHRFSGKSHQTAVIDGLSGQFERIGVAISACQCYKLRIHKMQYYSNLEPSVKVGIWAQRHIFGKSGIIMLVWKRKCV